ncbi:hypothetical protein [Actinoplanes sp. NPDC051851]|uniref:hypothetical protein n=1 Tax=Actinoplanes sp. NPDC051851 TaxID=3154753 RepID=UPI003424E732
MTALDGWGAPHGARHSAGPAGARPADARPPGIPRPRNQRPVPDDQAWLRRLAATGGLGTVSPADRRRLYRAAYAVAHPIVFDVVTRRVEQRRGHPHCARSLRNLDGPCLDAFYDDVEAVVEHLLAATVPIDDLEGWLASRALHATIDGHRRRRGERGALQRPRMSRALADALPDPWHRELALKILVWVGLPTGAGTGVWPVDSWARDRAVLTGDHQGSTTTRVQHDIDVVLGVMRQRPAWYEAHVERPLGHKTTPVAGNPGDNPGDLRPLGPVEPGEQAEAHIRAAAAAAVEAIADRLARGFDVTRTVETVLRDYFVDGTGADELDRPPRTGAGVDERISALFADPAARDLLTLRVLRIVRDAAG